MSKVSWDVESHTVLTQLLVSYYCRAIYGLALSTKYSQDIAGDPDRVVEAVKYLEIERMIGSNRQRSACASQL